jgi:protein-S-isoprenylcysteine O-methyltransferase Ste14
VVIVLSAVVLVVIAVVPASAWDALTTHAAWVAGLGLAVLVCSTAFALWARVALGTMWSLSPAVKDGHELRTEGPYGITRHPIYTALLGMLLGTVLVAGLGRSILILPVGIVLLELKLRAEEELMVARFPEEYLRYRQRVPQLVPGLRPRGERPGAC